MCLKLRRTEFEEPSVLSSTVSIFALCSGGTHYFSSLVAVGPGEMAEIVVWAVLSWHIKQVVYAHVKFMKHCLPKGRTMAINHNSSVAYHI